MSSAGAERLKTVVMSITGDSPPYECPVCLEEKPPLTAIYCPNEHAICLDCCRATVEPCGSECKRIGCIGFEMKCVVCRAKGAMRAPHLLALLHSSWQKSCDTHSSPKEQDLWEQRGLEMSHSTD